MADVPVGEEMSDKNELEIGHGRSGGQASTAIKFTLDKEGILVEAKWEDDEGRVSIIKDRIWRKSEKEKLIQMLNMMIGR